MRAHRFPSMTTVLAGVGIALLAMVLIGALGRSDPRPEPGQTWRRGFLSGEQYRLLSDGRYRHEQWCRVCSDELIATGTWAQMGDMVSLVPSRSDQPPRMMRKSLRGGERTLFDPAQAGTASEREDARFVLVD